MCLPACGAREPGRCGVKAPIKNRIGGQWGMARSLGQDLVGFQRIHGHEADILQSLSIEWLVEWLGLV